MKKRSFFSGLVILMVLAVISVAALFLFGNILSKNHYSVVYLSSGEIYVGRLTVFPRMGLTDSYLLLNARDPADPSKNNFQLTPIKDMVWAPDSLRINRKQVLFYGPLSGSSKIAQTLNSKIN